MLKEDKIMVHFYETSKKGAKTDLSCLAGVEILLSSSQIYVLKIKSWFIYIIFIRSEHEKESAPFRVPSCLVLTKAYETSNWKLKPILSCLARVEIMLQTSKIYVRKKDTFMVHSYPQNYEQLMTINNIQFLSL